MDSLSEEIYSLTVQEVTECTRHLMLGGGTRGGPLLVRGKGVRVYDRAGKDYIDCTSQSWAMYLGFANETINRIVVEPIQASAGQIIPPKLYLQEIRRICTELAAGHILHVVAYWTQFSKALEAKRTYNSSRSTISISCS